MHSNAGAHVRSFKLLIKLQGETIFLVKRVVRVKICTDRNVVSSLFGIPAVLLAEVLLLKALTTSI